VVTRNLAFLTSSLDDLHQHLLVVTAGLTFDGFSEMDAKQLMITGLDVSQVNLTNKE
jgi:hypothetical protein